MAVYKTHGAAQEVNVMVCVSNLATSYKELGEHDKAEEMYKKVSGARLQVGAPVRACVPLAGCGGLWCREVVLCCHCWAHDSLCAVGVDVLSVDRL